MDNKENVVSILKYILLFVLFSRNFGIYKPCSWIDQHSRGR